MQKPVLIPLGQLQPSPTNPRKHFDAGKLRELAENIAQHGVLQALLVRPVWCQGCRSASELAKRNAERLTLNAERRSDEAYEVVDGERRLRAMQIIVSESSVSSASRVLPMSSASSLPCDVRELTDTQVVEIQLITFITKEPLTASEEAKGFADLLKLKDDRGEPLHSRESIAKAVGRDAQYVYRHLKLLKLPAVAQTALDGGRIGTSIAVMVARIPHKDEREKAALAIVGPEGGEPMSVREAQRYIAENYMQELKGAPFAADDAALPGPEGAPLACEACPHRTGNNKELYFDGDGAGAGLPGGKWRGDVCTLPICYRAKCAVVFARASAAAVAKDKTVKVLEPAAAADIFSAHDKVSLRFDTNYVDVFEKPAEGLVRNEVDRAKLPTWEVLTEGREVPRVLLADGAGRMRTLVDRTLAIAAARENGEDIFVAGLAPRGAPAAKDKKAETEQRKQEAVALATSAALRAKIESAGYVLGLSEVLVDLAFALVGADGAWWVLKSRGRKKTIDQTSEQAFYALLDGICSQPKALLAVAVELLYARAVRANGVEKNDQIAELARIYGVDLKAVKAEALSRAKTQKTGKTQKTEENARTRDAEPVTQSPKVLGEWVRAHAAGMSVETIMKSYHASREDVEGALGAAKMKVKQLNIALAANAERPTPNAERPSAEAEKSEHADRDVPENEKICGLKVGKFIAVKTLLTAGMPPAAVATQLGVPLERVEAVQKKIGTLVAPKRGKR